MTLDEAQALLGDLRGKTVPIYIDDHLGACWAHTPDMETQIRFYADLKLLSDTVIEYYQDYFEEKDESYFDDEMNWTHATVIPFATVGGSAEHDDEEFFSDSFAFLFWDLAKQVIMSATTDDWDFEPLGTLDDLKTRLR